MIEAVFFDDGGVLNDNSLRGPQWRQLIGEYFPPRFDGTSEAWQEANIPAIESILGRMEVVYDSGSETLPLDYHDVDDIEWLKIMFDHVGISPPDDILTESRRASEWIMPRVKAAYPGIIEVVNELATTYTLYIASNGTRRQMECYLKPMGISHLFKEKFGSDILHALKNTPYYFQKMVEITGVDPSKSVMIDDKHHHLVNASSVGFHCIHSGLAGDLPGDFLHFDEVSMIPEIIRSIDR